MTNLQKSTFDFALEYLSFGWSVIPVGHDKKPLVAWKKYQEIKATKEEIADWFTNKYPNASIGVVTGKISNIIVVDIDPRHGGTDKEFQKLITVKSKTGGGGWHYFFKYEDGIQNKTGLADGIDIRGEGGYVVVPPSIHETGKTYEWLMSPQAHTPIISLLDEIKKIIGKQKEIIIKNEVGENKFTEVLRGVEEGKRNQTAASIVGKLLSSFDRKDWDQWAWPILTNWNEKNKPPLPEKELQNVFNSISTKELVKENQKEDFKPISLENLMSKQFSETKWLVEKLIPAESIVAVSGAPSAFKTWILLDLMTKIAEGQPLFDKFITSKSGVLFIDEETGEQWIKERMIMLNSNYDGPIFIQSKTGFKLTEQSTDEIIAFSKEKDIGLVIFDSLVRVSTAQDENNASEIAKVFKLFQKLNKAGLTVIFAHHHRKQGGLRFSNISQDMRGSSDILAGVDCHLAVERKENENSVVITQTKLRQNQEIKPFKLKILIDTFFKVEFAGECDEKITAKNNFKKAIEEFLSKSEKEICKTGLFQELKNIGVLGGKSTFKIAIDEMIKEEVIFTKQGEGNKTIVFLKPFEVQETLISQ